MGPDDEVGSLNHLTASELLRGVSAVRSGEVFTLQVPIGASGGDPVWPDRRQAVRTSVMDEGIARADPSRAPADGHRYADDTIDMHLQGSTQHDALGHVWYDDQLWNGYPAESTSGALSRASVLPIAERGVVGRGVLVDVARHRGVPHLGPGEVFDLAELLAAADAQGVRIEPRDVLLVRTGWVERFYELGAEAFCADFDEPGLTHSRELVEWFAAHEIPHLVTDLIGDEVTVHPGTAIDIPLHSALMRNPGVVVTEVCDLSRLAAACAADGRRTFLHTAAPLKVVGASGSPVHPVVIR